MFTQSLVYKKLTSVNMVNMNRFLVSNPVENVPLSCTVVLPFGLFQTKILPCFAGHILWKWTPKVGDKDLSCYLLLKFYRSEFQLELSIYIKDKIAS